MRGLGTLPKAHLHLHLTGAMRPSTLLDLAGRDGMTVPPPFPAGVRGSWADFQTRYDRARSVIRTSADIVRVVTEAAADDAADGCGWLEIQLDPTCYAPVLGGARAAVEAVLWLPRRRRASRPGGGGVELGALGRSRPAAGAVGWGVRR